MATRSIVCEAVRGKMPHEQRSERFPTKPVQACFQLAIPPQLSVERATSTVVSGAKRPNL